MRRNGPQKPDRDPLLEQIVSEMSADTRSNYALSAVSGLSGSTIRNWQTHKVRRPQSVSLQMMARALGKRIVMVDL